MGLPTIPLAFENSAQVVVPLNCPTPQEILWFESGRAIFTPWLSHSMSFSMYLTSRNRLRPLLPLQPARIALGTAALPILLKIRMIKGMASSTLPANADLNLHSSTRQTLELLAEYFCLPTNQVAELLRGATYDHDARRSSRRTLQRLHVAGLVHRIACYRRTGIVWCVGMGGNPPDLPRFSM